MRYFEIINEATIRVYHGTDAKFTQFDARHLGTAHGAAPSNMAGFHFTSDPQVAKTFGSAVKSVQISLDHPVTIDAKGRDYAAFKHVLNARLSKIDRTLHDGLIIKNYVDAGIHGEPAISTHYIVFDPRNIIMTTDAPVT